jgi:HEPN domain-containing protein
MGKREIVNHWLHTAERDWRSVALLYEGKQYVHALFFCHLVIEKILKAYWVMDSQENNPPRTHDLEHTRTKIEDVNQLRLWLLSGMQSR